MNVARRSISILLIATVTTGCANTASTGVPKIELSHQSPDLAPALTDIEAPSADGAFAHLTYDLLEGGTRTLGSFEGRPLVVNFFASWCPPCITEMPELQAVFEQFGTEVAFLGLSQDASPTEALDLVARTGVGYDIGWDPDLEVYQHFGVLTMPTTVFVSATGELVEVVSGPLDREGLVERIAKIRG